MLCELRSFGRTFSCANKFFLRSPLLFVLTIPLLAQRLPIEYFNGNKAVQSEVLVALKSPSPTVAAVLQILLKADIVRQVGGPSGPYLFKAPTKAVPELVALLSNHPDVLYAEPNYLYEVEALPSDPYFFSTWGLLNLSKPQADIGAVSAWDVSTGSKQNIIAVLDTGVEHTHPDLAANMWRAPTSFTVNLSFGSLTCPAGSTGFNALTRSCDPMDFDGHGTHVAGTIGAIGSNQIGVAGVNWNASIMALKIASIAVLDHVAVADAIDAIEFAIQVKNRFANTSTPANVRVLSNSWGGFAFSQALLNQINKANSNNMLFVAAAGNLQSNNDQTPLYPASYNAPNVISVAATNSSDQLASFSNFGPTSVHLGAPGDQVYSTWVGAGWAYDSGTSMAAPHVSGTAALVLSRCNLTTAALKANLLSNVDLLPALAGITATGGRLNANKSIRACAPPPPPPTSSGGAVFAGVETSTGGDWKGKYGSQGYAIAADSTNLPSYARVAITNAIDYTWLSSTVDRRALRKAASSSDRIASTWYHNGEMFLFDIDITDGQTHRVGLYLLDFDMLSRAQKIEVVNAATGAVLDQRTIGEYRTGKYIAWNVNGHVQLRVSGVGPYSAVVSGIFFDPASNPDANSATASFVKADSTTQGSWVGQYGSDGFSIADGSVSSPPYAQLSNLETPFFTWEQSSTDVRALQEPAGNSRKASTWHNSATGLLLLDLNLEGVDSRQVALYMVDWELMSRSQRIEVLDMMGNVLDTREVSSFGSGQYLVWDIQGNVQFRITATGPGNAVVSGVFFETPGFVIESSPATQTVTVGGSTLYSVSASPEIGFTGAINLSVAGLPQGAGASFTPSSLPGAGTTNLSISTSPSTPPGTYPITILGTHNSLIRSSEAVLVVNATTDFGITATPSSRSVTAGSNTTYAVATNSINGFAGSVGLTVIGLPTGANASFAPSSISGAGSSTLTISTTTSTPAGTYAMTIRGASGSLIHTASVNLTVAAPQDFGVSATPSSRTITAGSGTTYTATANAINGFSGTISLAVLGLPSGANASFSPSSISATGNSTVSISTSSSTPAGTYSLTIRGTSGSLVRTTPVTLVVNSASNFTVSATPSSRTITAGSGTTYTASLSLTGGFGGTVTFSLSGLPSGANGSFSPSSRSSSGNSTLTLSTSNSTPAGTYNVTVRGTSGGGTVRTTTITLVVTSSFTVSAPSSATVYRSDTVTVPVSVTALGGFNENVSFSVSNLPSGVTATFSPTSVTGGRTTYVTFRASRYASRNSYNITIRGTSGMTTRTDTLSLSVR